MAFIWSNDRVIAKWKPLNHLAKSPAVKQINGPWFCPGQIRITSDAGVLLKATALPAYWTFNRSSMI